MNDHPRFPARCRHDPLPADSGEWPRVRKVRRLPDSCPTPGVARRAVAVVAGILAWPLPLLLLFTASCPGLAAAFLMVIFPVHMGMAVAVALGRRANDHVRFMTALSTVLLVVLAGCTIGLVSELYRGAPSADLIMAFVVWMYCVLACSPGAVGGAYLGGRLMKRLSRVDAESRKQAGQKPALKTVHAGDVPYHYPRTPSRPRHG